MSNIRYQIGVQGTGLRSSSRTSTGSVGPTFRNGASSRQSYLQNQGHLQNSEVKSLVRVALKNQKRGEKIIGTNY